MCTMSVCRSCLNRQRSTIRGLRAYGLGFKQNTESKTLPPDTPGYVEIRPACEARASTGYNRIRLDTFPTPLPVKGRDTPGYMRYVRFPCSWCENQHTIQRDTLRYVCLLPCLPRTRTTQIQHDTFTMGGTGTRPDTTGYV